MISRQVLLLLVSLQLTSQELPTNNLPAQEMVAAAGISRNIEVTCGFNDNQNSHREYWIINGTVYNLYTENYPKSNVVHDSLYTLLITSVDICLNDTSFQCVIFPPTGLNAIVGRVTRLIVVTGNVKIM